MALRGQAGSKVLAERGLKTARRVYSPGTSTVASCARIFRASVLIHGVELWLEARQELVEAFEWYDPIEIVAIAHGRRRLGYWRDRL